MRSRWGREAPNFPSAKSRPRAKLILADSFFVESFFGKFRDGRRSEHWFGPLREVWRAIKGRLVHQTGGHAVLRATRRRFHMQRVAGHYMRPMASCLLPPLAAMAEVII